ncbi:hypothetical protein DFJ74DRAFT_125043 [Hyaloraphidium curvatum]|nr:hypothetical protein DFJ74DRAFT_125043 [Hyaloraphidium curvatum]
MALVLAGRTRGGRPAGAQAPATVGLLDVPVEIIFSVFSFLPRTEAFRVRGVCKLIDFVAHSYLYWTDCSFDAAYRQRTGPRVCYRIRIQPGDAVLRRVFEACGKAVRRVKVHAVTDQQLFATMLASGRNLRSLHLGALSTPAVLALFAALETASSDGSTHLTGVAELHVVATPAQRDPAAPDAPLSLIARVFPNLKALHLLLHSTLEPGDVASLTGLHHLVELSLANCDQLSSAHLSPSPFPGLRYLFLSHLRSFRDEDVLHLPAGLSLLALHGGRFLTDDMVPHLGRFRELEWFKVLACPGLSLAAFDPLEAFEPALGCPMVHSCVGRSGGLGMAFRRRGPV